jgi:hypothetical protein
VTTIAAIVLGGVLGWAGIAKIARAPRWRANLRAYALPRLARGGGFLLLPWVELSAAVALLSGRPGLGAAIAAPLITMFCIAVVRARVILGKDKLGCACFGTEAVHDYRVLLLRNAALGVLAGYLLAAVPIADARGPGLPGAGPTMFLTLVGLVSAAGLLWLSHQLVALRRETSPQPLMRDAPPQVPPQEQPESAVPTLEAVDASAPAQDARPTDT